MRPSLLPGLIAAARRNLDRGASSVRLFEIGRRYGADAEHPTLAFILAGERGTRGWQTGKAQAFDAFRREGRSRSRCSMRRARPSTICRSSPTPARPGTPAARRRFALGRRRSSRPSASCIRGFRRASTRPPVQSPRSFTSTRSRRAEPEAARDRPMRRPRSKPSPATSPSSSRPTFRPTALAPCDPRRRQGGDHRRAPVRSVRGSGRLVAGLRGHASAGGEELHRRADRRDLEAHRRGGARS